MPGFDKTGPAGLGPMTGKLRGLCRGMGGAGFTGRGIGRGMGGGMGQGGGGLRRGQGMVRAEEYPDAGPGETVQAQSAESGSGAEVIDLKRQVEQVAELLQIITEKVAALEAKK